jgi:peptidoglycan/LPS O-acetylase OafA/YrhL
VEQNLGELSCLFTIVVSIILWYFVDRPIDAWRQNMVQTLHQPKQQ